MSSLFSEILGLIDKISPSTTAYMMTSLFRADFTLPSPELLGIALITGTGIVANALADTIKPLLRKKGQKKTQITEITKPDGTRLLIVDIDEDMTSEEADRVARRINDAAHQSDESESETNRS